MQVPATNLPYLKLGNSDFVQSGEWAIAIGNPLGLKRTVTLGIISGTGRSAKYVGISTKNISMIQTDATINPGNSGGPLLNAKGEVIGVNCALIPNAREIGLAVPINTAQKIAQQLIAKGKAEHPYFGILLKPNNNSEFGRHSKTNRGTLVAGIVPHSPADKAGLRAKDNIKKINNQPVNTVDTALSLLENSSVGDELTMLVQRKKQTLLLTVKPEPMTNPTD